MRAIEPPRKYICSESVGKPHPQGFDKVSPNGFNLFAGRINNDAVPLGRMLGTDRQ